MVWKLGEGDPYLLLTALLREERGMEALPTIERKPGGKPWFPGHPHLHFSVSHSGPLCLCALGDKPLGADVEVLRDRAGSLPRYALSDEEYGWFRERGSRWEDFYTLWTLKEATVKRTGEGLRRPPRQIPVPLLEPGQTVAWQDLRFTALGGEGWRGAICE